MNQNLPERMLLSGDEAVALAAFNAGVHLGTGYPGTPSTEILEALGQLGIEIGRVEGEQAAGLQQLPQAAEHQHRVLQVLAQHSTK